MNNSFKETFHRHLKLLHKKLNLNENYHDFDIKINLDDRGKLEVESLAKKYKDTLGKYISRIENDIIDAITNPKGDSKKFFPANWTEDHLQYFYKLLYGKFYSSWADAA